MTCGIRTWLVLAPALMVFGLFCDSHLGSRLKMGLAPSFPIEMEPVSFEPSEFFSSTGKRRVVDNQELVVRCHATSFHRIHENIYGDMLEARRKFLVPRQHLEKVDFDELSREYPHWNAANIAEFRIEFINHDQDEDALLNFEDTCRTLDKLGDNSPLDLRYHYYKEAMTPELEKLDFHDFLKLCEMLRKARDEMDAYGLPMPTGISPLAKQRNTMERLERQDLAGAQGGHNCECPPAETSGENQQGNPSRSRSCKGKCKASVGRVDQYALRQQQQQEFGDPWELRPDFIPKAEDEVRYSSDDSIVNVDRVT